jgi:CBS domain-containing protein
MLVNASLVAFNLLPAFPMDGGRALRAVLAMRMEYTRATEVAASIGQGMALLFGFLGLMGNPILLFIALFVWIGATAESSVVQMKAALAGIPVQRAMMTQNRTLTPSDTLQTAADLLLSGSQRDFPVVQDGRLEGVLTREDLVAALTRSDRSVPVRQAMRQSFETTDVTEMLETALGRLKGQNNHTLPVLDRGSLAGLVTLDNIGEFLMIQAATRKGAKRH